MAPNANVKTAVLQAAIFFPRCRSLGKAKSTIPARRPTNPPSNNNTNSAVMVVNLSRAGRSFLSQAGRTLSFGISPAQGQKPPDECKGHKEGHKCAAKNGT